jgi:hypothetical protein
VSQALLTRAEAAEAELAIQRAVAAETPTAPGDSETGPAVTGVRVFERTSNAILRWLGRD